MILSPPLFFVPNDWCAVELKEEHGCVQVPPGSQAACQVEAVDRKGAGAVMRLRSASPCWVAILSLWNLMCDPAPASANVRFCRHQMFPENVLFSKSNKNTRKGWFAHAMEEKGKIIPEGERLLSVQFGVVEGDLEAQPGRYS